MRNGESDPRCGDSPPGYPAITCTRRPHDDDSHSSEGHWWSARQRVPIRKGHWHSDELFCTAICPGYRKGVAA